MSKPTRHTRQAANWRAEAACKGHDPDLWFPSGSGAAVEEQTREAKAICGQCPVFQDCGMWSIETRQGFGIWGGWTEKERRAYLRSRGIRIKEPMDRKDDEPRKTGRPPAECGTRSAYQRHVKKGEPIDEACRRANTRASARLRGAGTTKAAA